MGIAYGRGWGGGARFTSEATQFIKAAGITIETQKVAVDILVRTLKSSTVWTKAKAIYPFVGGTALAHSFNLKNVTKHRVSFGTTSHTRKGIIPGTDAPNLNLTVADVSANAKESFCAAFYVCNSVTNLAVDWGMYPDNPQGRIGGHIRYSGTTYFDMGSVDNGRVNTSYQGEGFYVFNKLGSTQSISFNGSKIVDGIRDSTPPQSALRINTNLQNGDANNREFAFAFFGEGLTKDEISLLSNAVMGFQAALGRNV